MNISNKFIQNYIAQNNIQLISFEESRPWGGFYTFEVQEKYDKKILWIKPGHFLSLQYHPKTENQGHSEVWKALTELKIVLGTKDASNLNENELKEEIRNLRVIKLKAEDEIEIPRGFLHSAVNTYRHDAYIIEKRISTNIESAETREKNIVRIFDQTQRNGLTNWPEDLVQKIKEY